MAPIRETFVTPFGELMSLYGGTVAANACQRNDRASDMRQFGRMRRFAGVLGGVAPPEAAKLVSP